MTKRSIYRSVTKEEVIKEYAEASMHFNDYEKAKWGSKESMFNRFRLALKLVRWEQIQRWLDIGCGVGNFFELVEAKGMLFKEIVGVDITPQLIQEAQKRSYRSPSRFVISDLDDLPLDLNNFDLVTLVGVLQQCGTQADQALRSSINRLVFGAYFFLTTKNLGWEAFTKGKLEPERNHSWFVYEEIADICVDNGLEIIKSGGFLPRKGEIVPIEQSHSFFILGRKFG